MKAKFYKCPICGNLMVKLIDGNQVPICCGKPMILLSPKTAADEMPFKSESDTEEYKSKCTSEPKGTTEQCKDKCTDEPHGATEYHAPVLENIGKCHYRVKIGKDPHPMTEEHHICFVAIETENGCTVRMFPRDKAACATFYLQEPPIAVYAYCNIHGLWMTTP